MKKTLSLFTFIVVLCSAVAFGQPGPQKGMMKDLNLTDAQKDQFEKIVFDTKKKQIELKAKLETSKLEIQRLMTAETLDKAAIEKKMNEIALQEVSLRMNRLNAWSEQNKILNADQQKIWKKGLLQHMRTMQKRNAGPMQERMMQGRQMHKRIMMEDMPPVMERNIEKKIIKE